MLPLLISFAVINVQFQDQEFSVEESAREREIRFIVTHPISADTHYLVLAMTYQEYDDRYADLKAQYPSLEPFSLSNEYDEAECKHETNKMNTSFILTIIEHSMPSL